jgi:tRNA threonylcarbamoyladenosine biosynthesis protein TsaE
MKKYIYIGKTDTSKVAAEIAKQITTGSVLLLYGELGSGKTYFTQQLCRHLKVSSFVNSPSYILMNEYSGNFPIYHYDLYRLTSSGEALELGILDRIKTGVTIIEWPELIENCIADSIRIFFEHNGSKRNLKIL